MLESDDSSSIATKLESSVISIAESEVNTRVNLEGRLEEAKVAAKAVSISPSSVSISASSVSVAASSVPTSAGTSSGTSDSLPKKFLSRSTPKSVNTYGSVGLTAIAVSDAVKSALRVVMQRANVLESLRLGLANADDEHHQAQSKEQFRYELHFSTAVRRTLRHPNSRLALEKTLFTCDAQFSSHLRFSQPNTLQGILYWA